MPRHPTSNGLTRDPLITLLMMQARGTVVYKQGLTAFLWLSPEPETAEIFLLPLASGALGLETTAAPLLLGRDTAKVKPKDRHYRFGVTFSRATLNKPDLPCRSETRLRTLSANPLSFAVQPRNSPEQRVLATVERVTARPLTALVKEFEIQRGWDPAR